MWVHEISADQYKTNPKEYDLVIDCREASELAGGWLPEAQHAPMGAVISGVGAGLFGNYKVDRCNLRRLTSVGQEGSCVLPQREEVDDYSSGDGTRWLQRCDQSEWWLAGPQLNTINAYSDDLYFQDKK